MRRATFWHSAVKRCAVLLQTISATALVLLMLVGFGDVFARYFFSASIVQREEIFNVLLITVFVCSFPLITLRRDHLDVDLLDRLFAGPLRRKLQFFLIDFSVAVSCLAMSYWMYDKAGRISRPGREVLFQELDLQQSSFAYAFAAMLFIAGGMMLLWALWHLYAIISRKEDVIEIKHKDNL